MLGLEMMGFSVDDGYPEAICRSLRKGFLTEAEYLQLKATTNLQEFKQVLENTDYADYIAGDGNLEIVELKRLCKVKLITEIKHMMLQSTQPLTGFFERILHCYQIDNVVGIIEGVKNEQKLEILLKGSDPLGYFPDLKNAQVVDSHDYTQLYQEVLIDHPIGVYFRKFLDQELKPSQEAKDARAIMSQMQDFKPETTKNLLKKIWFTEFYNYCMDNLPGDTSIAMMDDLLKFESDCMTLQTIYNTLDI